MLAARANKRSRRCATRAARTHSRCCVREAPCASYRALREARSSHWSEEFFGAAWLLTRRADLEPVRSSPEAADALREAEHQIHVDDPGAKSYRNAVACIQDHAVKRKFALVCERPATMFAQGLPALHCCVGQAVTCSLECERLGSLEGGGARVPAESSSTSSHHVLQIAATICRTGWKRLVAPDIMS